MCCYKLNNSVASGEQNWAHFQCLTILFGIQDAKPLVISLLISSVCLVLPQLSLCRGSFFFLYIFT